MVANKVSILAVGDIVPDWTPPEFLFEPAHATLKQADIRFGQLECPLSDNAKEQIFDAPIRTIKREKVAGLMYAGFDVISFAANHASARGEEGFYDTLDTLEKAKITVIGAGRNIVDARKPAIFERHGSKIGFLGYLSIVPKNHEAREDKPGIVPLRASGYYEPIDWHPGSAPRVVTFPNKEDLDAMIDDVKKLRPLVDVLIVSMHFGLHHVPAVIAMYQKDMVHAAIDAGADLILGHHAHVLKGIDVYKGKVVFYSLANFVMPSPKGFFRPGYLLFDIHSDPEYPYYTWHKDAKRTIIAKCVIANKKIERVSFLPVMMNKMAQPEVMRRKDPGFTEVLNYMKDITEGQGLTGKYAVDGDEVVVTT